MNHSGSPDEFWNWLDRKEQTPPENIDQRGPLDARTAYALIYGRPITGAAKRRYPSTRTKEEVERAQRGRCLYCDHAIGSYVIRKGVRIRLRTHWDHFIPYSYSYANSTQNWVLSCHVCNLIKSCMVFDSVMDAQAYVKTRWREKGYEASVIDEDAVTVAASREVETLALDAATTEYVDVPTHLVAYAHIVSRRLRAHIRPVPPTRITQAGGNQSLLREALEALVAGGYVRRRAGAKFADTYWSVRSFEIDEDTAIASRAGLGDEMDMTRPVGRCGRCGNTRRLISGGALGSHLRISLIPAGSTRCEGSYEFPAPETSKTGVCDE